MIGKVLTFILGFITGTLFGIAMGRWLLEQIINYIQLKGGI